MWTLIRIVTLAVILAVVVPAVAPNTAVGQFFSAVVDDVLGFCQRQPTACHATRQVVLAGRDLIAERVEGFAPEPQTLTSADRVLQPAGGSSASPRPLQPPQGS